MAKAQKGEYVDGFVLVVPKNKMGLYRKMAQLGKKIWLKHGALDYKECVGNDLEPQTMEGAQTLSFTKLTKAKTTETVLFSFITFKSKKHRDEVNTKVMKDSEMNDPAWKDQPMPFDMKKMAYGGFEVIVGA